MAYRRITAFSFEVRNIISPAWSTGSIAVED
jgi:hypothetical protein